MSEVKRYTAWAAEVALPRGTMVVLAADYDRDTQVLRAALAEAKYRIEQGRVWAGTDYKLTGLHPLGQQKALDVIDAALAGQQQQGEPCDFPPEGWFCTRSKGHEGPCAAVLHDWGVASYSLDLNWGNGRSAHDGQMTMEQYGAICRVLSPDWKGEHTDLCGPGHDVGRAVAVQVQICKLGMYGQAYDTPGTCRAYTYADQPGNDIAHRLGDCLRAAHCDGGGDFIDFGLALLRRLQDRGFGVFQITTPSAQQKESGDE